MFTTTYLSLSIALLAAVSSAAPLPLVAREECTPGLFNCFDGKSYAQCDVGGIWSATMQVSAGNSCQPGISANPFVAGDSSPASPAPVGAPAPASASPASPAPAPAQQPTTSAPAEAAAPPPPPPAAAPATTSPAASDPSPVIPQGLNTGNGQFPPIASWPSWSALVAKYQPILGTSCEAQGWGANNSPAESAAIIQAIESQAGPLDPRFLLAAVVQESSGCVRVKTTDNGVRNPGLLQTSNGVHSCNDGGNVQSPCPDSEINGMITDGASGGANNFAQALASAQEKGFGDSMAYAVAARIYNSGSADLGDLNNGLGSTAGYVTQLMGRVAGLSL